MTKFQDGYQACLADIQAVIENAVGDARCDRNLSLAALDAVEEWIINNTISKSKSQMYRGYWIQDNKSEKSFEVYASESDGSQLVDMIDFFSTITAAKKMIDKWMRVK